MAKFRRISKLTKSEQEDLFVSFCQAVASLKNEHEVAVFLKDLLGINELEMLAKRLEIAKFLLDGWTYDEIAKLVKVSHSTVARVSFWMQQSGTGFKMVAQRAKKKEKKYSQWEKDMKRIKRTYSRYFWPELMFDEIVKQMGRRKHEKLVNTIENMEDKKEIMDEFNRTFQELYNKNKNVQNVDTT